MSLLDLLKRKVPLLVLLDATGQAQYDKNLLQFVEPNNFDFDFRQINTYAKESCYLSSSHIQTFFSSILPYSDLSKSPQHLEERSTYYNETIQLIGATGSAKAFSSVLYN